MKKIFVSRYAWIMQIGKKEMGDPGYIHSYKAKNGRYYYFIIVN